MRHNEREKNVLVDELAAQNARLTSQLQAANQLEVQLSNKLQELKSQYNIQHQTLQVSNGLTPFILEFSSFGGIWHKITHFRQRKNIN